MGEQMPEYVYRPKRGDYGKDEQPTAQELEDAYINSAPSCHRPARTVERVPVTEVPEEFFGPIAARLARNVEDEIILAEEIDAIGEQDLPE
jgi:hypothetical protein